MDLQGSPDFRKTLGLIGLILVGLGASPEPLMAQARQKTAPQPKIQDMTLTLVRNETPECKPDCREWIAAEGRIMPTTPLKFRAMFRAIGDKKLPILIHSGGGSIAASIEIAQMIRQRGHDVAVLRTAYFDCSPREPGCVPPNGSRIYQGTPMLAPALCSSACVLVLAGGTRRLVHRRSAIGVHRAASIQQQIRQRVIVHYRVVNGRRVEVGRRVVAQRVVALPKKELPGFDPIYHKMAEHYRKLGVQDSLVRLSMRSGMEDMYWLKPGEILETGIATQMKTVFDIFPEQLKPGVTKIAVSNSFTEDVISVEAHGNLNPRNPKIQNPVIASASQLREMPLFTHKALLEFVGKGDIKSVKLEIDYVKRQRDPFIAIEARLLIDGASERGKEFDALIEFLPGRNILLMPSQSWAIRPVHQVNITQAEFCRIVRDDTFRIFLRKLSSGEIMGTWDRASPVGHRFEKPQDVAKLCQ